MSALAEDLKLQVDRDIYSCRECKKCLLECPLPELKGLDVLNLNREVLSESPSKDMLRLAFLCFSCGACNYSCPRHQRMDLRLTFLKSKGRIPRGYNNLLHWRGQEPGLLGKFLYSLKKRVARPHRRIAEHLDKTEFRKTDLLFYFSCYAFSPTEVPWKTLAIADHLGLDYEVVAGYGSCCGWPHFLAGDFNRAERMFIDLFNLITRTGAMKVVTGCAECYRALTFIKERYAGGFRVLSTSEWLTEHLNKLELEGRGVKATFHDACQLVRFNGKPGVPRKIIKRLFNLVEMEERSRSTLCCGGMRQGHGREELRMLRERRLSQARRTGAEIMLTECITCYEVYKPLAEGIQVMDLVEAVYDSIAKKG